MVHSSHPVIVDVIQPAMTLSRDYRKHVRKLCVDYMLADASLLAGINSEIDKLFAEFSNPEELHWFADNWNWDAGIDRLRQLLEHPLCEFATALRIYWLAASKYYLKYKTRDDVPTYELAHFDFIKWIETRYAKREFKDGNVFYDPAKNWSEVDGRGLPHIMYEAVGRRRSLWQAIFGS